MDQLIGKTLHDRYFLQALLGQNPGKPTFLASDDQTSSQVILKLLLFGTDITWENVRLFEREASVLQSLDHPAIPKYLDYFEVETENGKGFALVQTWINARSLKDWVVSGRTFSEGDLKTIAKELLHILNYLHHRQPAVVHRDLKPSNILLGDRSGNHPGKVYLVDFGSVQTAIKTHGTRTIVGTYGYMPPEQFGGQTRSASDLYALGATLVYLATGQNPVELPQREMRLIFENQVNLSPTLIRWLKRITNPDLDRRFQSAEVALAALDDPKFEQSSSVGIVTQPLGSKVAVTKTEDYLEVFIAPQGLNGSIGLVIFFTIFWDGFLIFWYSIAILTWTSGGWAAALFASPHLLVGIGITWGILFSLFGTTEVKITRSHIHRVDRMFGINFSHRTFPRDQASAIEVTKRTYQQGSEGPVEVPPKLILWFGVKQIELGSGILKEPDLVWLAQELSHWLNIPINP